MVGLSSTTSMVAPARGLVDAGLFSCMFFFFLVARRYVLKLYNRHMYAAHCSVNGFFGVAKKTLDALRIAEPIVHTS